MIGIYHEADLDGITSGVIMRLRFPEIKLMGHDYGKSFQHEEINEPVIMSDISLPMEEMVEVASNCDGKLTWIDHHISAINAYNDYIGDREPFCHAVLENGRAACEGTWDFLFPDNPMPLAVKLLGEYDTWRNADKAHWDNEILPFQFGMRVICKNTDTFPVRVLEDEGYVREIINDGKLILQYQEQINEKHCREAAFEYQLCGRRAICLNGGEFNSGVFKSVYNEDKHDIMIVFRFNGKHWKVSLYTTQPNVDCSSIAKLYGGGGHKQAAGFQINDMNVIFGGLLDNYKTV
jgi:oligoribonuclease NrnB/cAMP/cGMP phosphodiesterase (DHH superfamily)